MRMYLNIFVKHCCHVLEALIEIVLGRQLDTLAALIVGLLITLCNDVIFRSNYFQ